MCHCNNIFNDFSFTDLTQSEPPASRGVYVIRVKNRGVEVTEILNQYEHLLENFNWTLVKNFLNSRCSRLNNIYKCNIIYIGSAGTQRNSNNTLKSRYREFANRHTIMYPLWLLIYFNWKLEYGYFVCTEPAQLEQKLKRKYHEIHNNLPALVIR